MTADEAYMLWRTGEIQSPPKEFEAYCKQRLSEDRRYIRLVKQGDQNG